MTPPDFTIGHAFLARAGVSQISTIMCKINACLSAYVVLGLIDLSIAAVYTYEDIELRRLFPSEFPQDTIRKSGAVDPEQLGRYNELKHYFKYPKTRLNSHFEELACYEEGGKKVCKIDQDRYSPEEDSYYSSSMLESHVDRRRVYCFMLLCFTEDELDRIVSSF